MSTSSPGPDGHEWPPYAAGDVTRGEGGPPRTPVRRKAPGRLATAVIAVVVAAGAVAFVAKPFSDDAPTHAPEAPVAAPVPREEVEPPVEPAEPVEPEAPDGASMQLRTPRPGPDRGESVRWSQVQAQLDTPLAAGEFDSPYGAWTADDARTLALVSQAAHLTGSHYATSMQIRPGWAQVVTAARGKRPLLQQLDLTGDQVTVGEQDPTGEKDIAMFDLRRIDVTRLKANVRRALTRLGVEDATLSYILFRAPSVAGEVPEIGIYVGNTFEESAYLWSTFDGKTVRAYPFD